MTLRDWLKQTGTEHAAFAALLGVHCVTVYKWASGAARPSYGKLVQIENATGGQVTARTLAQQANDGPVRAASRGGPVANRKPRGRVA